MSKPENFNKTHNKGHQHKLCKKSLKKCFMGRELLGEEDGGDGDGDDGFGADFYSGDDIDHIMDDMNGEDMPPAPVYPAGPSTSGTKKKKSALGSIFNVSMDKKAMKRAGISTGNKKTRSLEKALKGAGAEDQDYFDEGEKKKKKKKKKKIGLGWGNPLTPGASPAGMVAGPGESISRGNKKLIENNNDLIYRATSPEEAFALLTRSKTYWSDEMEQWRKGQKWFSDRSKAEEHAELRGTSYILVADRKTKHPQYAIDFKTGNEVNLSEVCLRLMIRKVVKENHLSDIWNQIDGYSANSKKEKSNEDNPLDNYQIVAHPQKVRKD